MSSDENIYQRSLKFCFRYEKFNIKGSFRSKTFTSYAAEKDIRRWPREERNRRHVLRIKRHLFTAFQQTQM